MIETAEQLLERLATEGGCIVSTAACSTDEINLARSEGRMFVNANYLGFVLRLPEVVEVAASYAKVSFPTIPTTPNPAVKAG